jgi:signal transduction histidine kinase/CheY-like chemotaxis protein/streptogramin lyase
VFAICEDQHQNLWIGTNGGGLNLLDRATGKFKHFINNPNNSTSISNNNIKAIYNDSYGNLWIGTRGGGLSKYNYNNNSFTNYTHNPENNKSIGSDLINTIYETSDGTLWIGTAGSGLDKMNRTDNSFQHFNINSEDSNSINDIFVLSLIEDHEQNLWIGTFNGGLNKFDIKKEEFTHFTIDDGLTSNIIYSIEIDNDNNLWLSSNGALTKFSIKDHSVINYNTNNGLENMEFNLNSSFKTKDGILYFGGMNGINYFDPETFNPEIKHTSFHFTKLVLNNEITHDGKNKPIHKSITFESQIKLNYDEYPFSIYFSLLDFKYINNNTYEYRIKELNDTWIDIGTENKITFTKLSSGKYTLDVKASNSFNLLSESKSIEIIIMPPFWKKIWFISLELIVLLFLIIAYMYYHERKIRRNNKELEFKVRFRTKELENQKEELKTAIEFNQKQQEQIKKQNTELELHKNNLEGLVEKRTVDLEKAKNKAEESDHLKSSFLANVSHEIRTPMNAIVGFSELLKDTGDPTPKQLNMLKLILFNSHSLLNLINDIVDIAKLETGEIQINKSNLDINILLKDLFDTYFNNKELKLKNLKLNLLQFNEPIILFTDEIRVKQIFSKLLDNAIKYTEKGNIEFGYKMDDENRAIQFFVKDSGIGLSSIQQEEIFKLFRKIETNKNKLYRGIGLGLTFCHKLVQILLGEIWVESKENIGSTFYFTLPISTTSKLEPKNIKMIPNYNWKNKNILIAEDEINNYMFLKAALKSTQANIFHAKNGEEAVKITNSDKNIDLIIMDLKMPVMDGLEATKIIRETNKEIKIIAFTAYAMTNDEALAIDYGCDDYISKPAKPQHIMRIISEHLN